MRGELISEVAGGVHGGGGSAAKTSVVQSRSNECSEGHVISPSGVHLSTVTTGLFYVFWREKLQFLID